VTSSRLAPTAALLALLAGCAHGGGAAETGIGPESQLVPLDNPSESVIATAMFEETNRARLENGQKRLLRSPQLEAAADEQAFHMATLLRAEHSNPIAGEHTAADRAAREGLVADRVTENALMIPARRPGGSPERDYTYAELASVIVRAWMSSPEHRANLLDPNVTFVGCAARIAHSLPDDDRVFATQVFYLPTTLGPMKDQGHEPLPTFNGSLR
jgi:uncharacterized protein YkwD